MIELENVSKLYSNEAGQFSALKEVTLSINKGEFVGIIGKSGSGKSTLLHILSGIDSPTKGTVTVLGKKISSFPEKLLTKWRCFETGIVFQSFYLLQTLTLLENVMLPMEFSRSLNRKKRKERALMLLERVGLQHKANLFPDSVSGGEKQRCAIARALANDPPLLLADEPTGNLDSENAEQIFSLFNELSKQGKTIVMVTHDTDFSQRVSRSLLVKDGVVSEQFLLDKKAGQL
ncbi:ABC transporter ATP-binding protein [Bacillus sp. CECT 9360]|uniref:ABC transporter ATP-binding protein n=1 Tax=Bacillus sp. CECT 9360 TaxID=2845821 RepID=UPI001E35D0FD|nr:ABC transporter ATP-binding protein [Bacillus sp. CECT 9360]CAH0344249.1 putative ABC transporter ATP-binding protein YknY [Bacillus sp. CECT 9360]